MEGLCQYTGPIENSSSVTCGGRNLSSLGFYHYLVHKHKKIVLACAQHINFATTPFQASYLPHVVVTYPHHFFTNFFQEP